MFQTDFPDPIRSEGCYFLALLAAAHLSLPLTDDGTVAWQLDQDDVLRLYRVSVYLGLMNASCFVQRPERLLNVASAAIDAGTDWRYAAGRIKPQQLLGRKFNDPPANTVAVSCYELQQKTGKAMQHFVLDTSAPVDDNDVLYDPWRYPDGSISRTRRRGKLSSVRIFHRGGNA